MITANRSGNEALENKYNLERVLFLQQIQFDKRFQNISRKIEIAFQRIDAIRSTAAQDEEALELYGNLRDLDITSIRPRNPKIEKTYKLEFGIGARPAIQSYA